jgi:hypothetical protein
MVFSAPFYLLLDAAAAERFSAGLVAPLVEETAKGIVLFFILFFWRHELDSPLDGIIYGAMVGMGFAMVENVLYYVSAFQEDGAAGWGVVVIMRGVIFGLSHALYASLTGLGIAVARLSGRWSVRIGAPLLGWGAAVFLHATHNVAMSSGTALAFLAGLTFDWGGVMVTAAIILLALYQERRWMREYLAEEVERGVLSADEYAIVPSALSRTRHRLGLLTSEGVTAYRRSGRRFQQCSELAYHMRHHAHFGDPRSLQLAERLRNELTTDFHGFNG